MKDPNANEGIHSSYMDSSKAKELLDFSTDYNFATAVEEIHLLMRGWMMYRYGIKRVLT